MEVDAASAGQPSAPLPRLPSDPVVSNPRATKTADICVRAAKKAKVKESAVETARQRNVPQALFTTD